MIKTTVVFLFGLLFLSGCSFKEEPQPQLQQEAVKQSITNKKVFAQEDFYILVGLDAQNHKQYKDAAEVFEYLYEQTQNKEYLYLALENRLYLKEYALVLARTDFLLQKGENDPKLMRFKVVALSNTGKLQEAQELALKLASMTDSVSDHLLVSTLYSQQKAYKKAYEYLKKVYAKEYNEDIVDKMAMLLYLNLEKKQEAIDLLETHTKVHGCSKKVCMRLAQFYSTQKDLDGLLAVYMRMYEQEKDEEIAKKIIQIYTYKREYFKLIDFLEANDIDDTLLLNVYVSVRDYKEASRLADKLYEETGDINYLGQSALYEYEAYGDGISQKALDDIITKLKAVIQRDANDTLYLNYLGYILIDHDIDVKEGIGYVQKALSIEPNSAYYLDSLAWGYFKLGECKKADAIMKKVIDLGEGEQPEVKEHISMIKKCLRNSKKR